MSLNRRPAVPVEAGPFVACDSGDNPRGVYPADAVVPGIGDIDIAGPVQ